MGLNSSLSGISFSGLSSGIDTDGIISRLMELEAIPLQRLQLRKQEISQKQSVYSAFRSKLQALSTSASSLNVVGAFNPVTASSSDTAVATISAGSGGTAGTYSLSVSKLAQAQKIASAAQADTVTALGKAGVFVVNGKAVTVEATDSLKTIAGKINSANAGVTASLIDGGAGNAYLTINSSKTGVQNKVQIADLSGDSINAFLGITSGAATIRQSITDGAASTVFAKNDQALGTMMGVTGAGPASFTINGTTVNIDLATDNLQQVADKINAAAAGATASVKSVDENGTTKYRLEIVGDSGTPTFADVTGNALKGLGILQEGYGNQLLAAQDVEYKLDGIALTSATNTITTAIPGATLTLLKADATTPTTSTLTLKSDSDAVKKKVQEFVNAYNDAVEFVRANSAFDKETFATGPLFGDSTAQQLEQSLNSLMFTNVPGLTGQYTNLTTLGFKQDNTGKISFDESTFVNALSADPEAVANLFRTSGTGSTGSLTFVSAGNKTVATGTGSYEVSISALATKGSYTGELAQTGPSSVTEQLTFSGNLFGSTPYKLTLNAGNTLQDTIDAINSDSKLRDLLVASDDGTGKLKIESKRYGTSGNFTVVSNYTAAADNSGIGVGSLGAKVVGTDIQGTINGEEATGSGQFLTGKTGNANTEGLQIQYTGNTLGLIGSVSVRKGIGTQMFDMMSTFTDTVNGILTGTDNTLKAQLEEVDASITEFQSRLALKQSDLRAKFTRMEEAISRIQSQGSRLAALNTQNTSK